MNASRPQEKEARQQAPLVTAVSMGYGHLRAAHALADAAGVPVVRGDELGVAGAREAALWRTVRHSYEAVSRLSQAPHYGIPFRFLLETMTEIPPPYPVRDLSRAEYGSRIMEGMIEAGLGASVARRALETGQALLTTFYAQAVAAERHGAQRVACVVTDTDIHRIWAPVDSRRTRILYLAPSRRVIERLRAYGVPEERIRFTGFPLPPELLGGRDLPVLKANLARRLVRLDPENAFLGRAQSEIEQVLGPLPMEERGRPPRITVAVGGAGAQTPTVLALLNGLAEALRYGRLRLALVAGIRPEVASLFRMAIRTMGLHEVQGAVEVVYAPDFPAYYRLFNRLLADTDVLWTKPSEMVFYAALGLPLVLAPPMGRHENNNERWVADRGAAVLQRAPHLAAGWTREWMEEGVLAAAAWAGFRHLPQMGTYRILDAVAALEG